MVTLHFLLVFYNEGNLHIRRNLNLFLFILFLLECIDRVNKGLDMQVFDVFNGL